MCVNEAGSIRLMEEKDVEQVEELEKQCFSVPWSENILKDGLTGRFDTYLGIGKKIKDHVTNTLCFKVLTDDERSAWPGPSFLAPSWNSQKPDG